MKTEHAKVRDRIVPKGLWDEGEAENLCYKSRLALTLERSPFNVIESERAPREDRRSFSSEEVSAGGNFLFSNYH